MQYEFKVDVKATDLWKITMRTAYHSLVGVVNLVFTLAMVALIVSFWGKIHPALTGILFVAALYFPAIRPLMLLGQSAKQLESMPKDMTLGFSELGVRVTTPKNKEDIAWSRVVRVTKQKDCVVFFTDAQRGYILTNRVLGEQKDEFYEFLLSRVKKHAK